MVSKTGLTEEVKAFDWRSVDADLSEAPTLLGHRDKRGRNWLHLCCSVDIRGKPSAARDSIRTADVLLEHGLDLQQIAFTEGAWKATPVWFAVARGRNLGLAEHLLERGADPNFSLFAASYNDDRTAIRLLIRYGATVDDTSSGGTPFLGAVQWSRFGPAEELLDHGADVDHRDASGMTALHYMLKKRSDIQHIAMVVAHGARGDIPDKDGLTAVEIMRRKKDPDIQRLADALRKA